MARYIHGPEVDSLQLMKEVELSDSVAWIGLSKEDVSFSSIATVASWENYPESNNEEDFSEKSRKLRTLDIEILHNKNCGKYIYQSVICGVRTRPFYYVGPVSI